MRTKNRSVSKATQRLEKVKEGRRQKLSALKDAFFRVTEKCPCCKGGVTLSQLRSGTEAGSPDTAQGGWSSVDPVGSK